MLTLTSCLRLSVSNELIFVERLTDIGNRLIGGEHWENGLGIWD